MASRETTHINLTTVNRAAKMARDGKTHEISDSAVKRLSIRIRSGSAKWILRLRIGDTQTTRMIASLDQIRDPEQVRALAIRGRELGKKGEDPAPLFEGARLKGTADVDAAKTEAAKRSGSVWTWDQLVKLYLDYIKEQCEKETHRSYKSAIKHEEAEAVLSGKALTEITDDDVYGIRQALVDRKAFRQASSTVQQIKQALTWACRQKGSGIKLNPAREVGRKEEKQKVRRVDAVEAMKNGQPIPSAQNKKRIRYMSEEELGAYFWELDTLPRRDIACVLKLQMLTVSRRITATAIPKDAFKEDPKWGMVWDIAPEFMKNKRRHVLPLTETAQKVVRLALEMSRPDNPWLFPQVKPYRKGDPTDGYIELRTVNKHLSNLQAEGRRLHSDRPFGTHIVRHTFSTHMTAKHLLDIPKEIRAIILAHSDESSNPTTEDIFYNGYEYMKEKHQALTAWESIILELMEKHAPNATAAAD